MKLQIAGWLNRIAKALATQMKLDALRTWDISLKNTVARGSSISHKPDIILMDVGYTILPGNKSLWKVVHAYTKVTVQQIQYKLTKTTYQKLFAIFKMQPCRQFIPSLTFNCEFVTIYVCDCASVVHTTLLIGDCKKVLVQMVVGFAFGEEYLLGYDLTMKHHDNEIIAILVDGEEYVVVEKLFSSLAMRDHVTQCWHVCKGDQEFIIKDSWMNIN